MLKLWIFSRLCGGITSPRVGMNAHAETLAPILIGEDLKSLFRTFQLHENFSPRRTS